MGSSDPAALAGIRVLDLATLYAGPLLAAILGDFGADVIKVEHPRGDDARRWGLTKGDVPLWWKVISRNKKLVSLDLHSEADRQRVRDLAGNADVVIENFRPGRLEQWELGYEHLHSMNPRLVMVRVSGFGQYGPYSRKPGFGTLAEAFSGFAHMTGQADGPPTLPPFGLADGVAAMAGAYAVMAALYWRDAKNSGRGQMIDLSLYEPLFTILGPQIVEYAATGTIQRRQGNRSPRTAPRNLYETLDHEWVALSAGTQQIANRIFEAIGQPELQHDERFSTATQRVQNAEAVDAVVADWIRKHSLETVLTRFERVDAPIAAVYDAKRILGDPHYLARESTIRVEDDDLGEVTMQNVVPKLSVTPGRVRHPGRTTIGADNEEIMGTGTAEWPTKGGACSESESR